LLQQVFSSSSMPRTPLNIPQAVKNPLKQAIATAVASVSTLPNGIRVVSRDQPGASSVGVFFNTGSRNDTFPGATSAFEGQLLKSTSNRSEFRTFREMSKLGITFETQSSREHVQLTAETLRENVPYVVNAFADSINNNLLEPTEVEATASFLVEKAQDAANNPESVVMEALHRAAFSGQTLGKTVLPAASQAANISAEALASYFETFATPGNITVAGVGVDHTELVGLVSKAFSKQGSTSATAFEPAKYTGGEARITNLEVEGGLAHVALAFPTANWLSRDLVGMCVLQTLMGGGGSFSAGGPGKGMCSRVYETVLNQYHFVEQANCFNSIFSDAALFGIYGAAQPEYIGNLAEVLVSTLKGMGGSLRAGELSRAKNQLKSNLAMQLELRPMLLEDMGRQILTYNKVQSAQEVQALIDQVTEADVQRIARQMMSAPVSLAAYGDLTNLPNYSQFEKQFKF
jgi:mitochondrial-processing peptidase subunit alpha